MTGTRTYAPRAAPGVRRCADREVCSGAAGQQQAPRPQAELARHPFSRHDPISLFRTRLRIIYLQGVQIFAARPLYCELLHHLRPGIDMGISDFIYNGLQLLHLHLGQLLQQL